MQPHAVIIGAGFGGLAAALCLAGRQKRVTVFEADARPGGKAGRVFIDGVSCDTGPSVLTMTDVFERVFADAGLRLEDHVELVRHDPGFDYRWPDGTRLLVYHELADTIESVRTTLGAGAAGELEAFLRYARRIWEAAAPAFVFGPAPSVASLSKLPLATLAGVRHIDALRSMRRAVYAYVADPHLRDLLLRYATYNGSDPRVAPATLNCIAHVELALGGWGVRGGIAALVDAMVAAATSRGAEFRFGEKVDRIEVSGAKVTGVTVAGTTIACDAVVSNADVSHLGTALLRGTDHPIRTDLEPSMSGYTFIARSSRARFSTDAAHVVLFPAVYHLEFDDIFDGIRPPVDPTVYVCRQNVAHRTGGIEHGEPLFAMANAPAEPIGGHTDPAAWATLEVTMRKRLVAADLLDEHDQIAWRRSPTDLARQYPGTRGAIYGAASNDRFAAFRRAPNRIAQLGGLYVASGSAHPGGGVPLCAQSGRSAAEAWLADRGETR
jgi:phytoene desaturase